MSGKSSSRFYLADLVMAALMCGLVASLFTGTHESVNGGLIFALIVVVAVSWSLFRAGRRSPTCVECGRRFIPPEPSKASAVPTACPHCGREQVKRQRAIRRWRRVTWGSLAILFTLVIAVSILLTGDTRRPTGGQAVFMLIAAGGCQFAMLTWIGAGLYSLRLARPRERPCEACRAIIPLETASGPAICPQCSVRHLRPDVATKERKKSLRIGLAFLVMIAILAAFLFPRGRGGEVLGLDPWIGVPLAMLALFLASFASLVLMLLAIQIRRRRRLRGEHGTLAMARRAAGKEGDIVRDGPWTIWYSGWSDPTPMVLERLAAGVRRLEDLTGGTAIAMPACRVVVLEDRGKFLAFHRPIFAGLDLSSLDGLHLGSPYHLITLCSEPPPNRVASLEATMRLLAAHAGVEAVWGPRPPTWLQTGLARASGSIEASRLDRLNRRMTAPLASEDAWSATLFSTSLNDLTRLLRGAGVSAKYRTLHQFHNQSWSIVEYLVGDRAPVERRAAMGAYLRDPGAKAEPEDAFRGHLGLGFEELLEGWRAWVLEQGIGAYEPPPERVLADLVGRVLPAIRDPRGRRGDRLGALRDWASHGYPIGADAVIALLRDPGEIPKEELAWALAMVSGNPRGDDPDRWQAWWDELEDAVTGRAADEARVGG